MIEDVKCPYCGAPQEICHDDGYGYEEGKTHNQECSDCEKTFVFTTEINFYYEAAKADCLNGGEHKYKATRTYPVEYTKMECVDCGHRRKPTEKEMTQIADAACKAEKE